MTTQEQFDAKKKEYEDLCAKIDGMEPGAVRLELKRKANGLTGEIASLRRDLIHEELRKENPQNVPRVRFHEEPEHASRE